jgi:hypothetical protein
MRSERQGFTLVEIYSRLQRAFQLLTRIQELERKGRAAGDASFRQRQRKSARRDELEGIASEAHGRRGKSSQSVSDDSQRADEAGYPRCKHVDGVKTANYGSVQLKRAGPAGITAGGSG